MKLTHLNADGQLYMVDVSEKNKTKRVAEAEGSIEVSREVIALLNENKIPKGNVLSCAKVAGIMAAKNTPNLIPLCHGISLSQVDIKFKVNDDNIEIGAVAIATDATGVEMEALTAVSVAALTIYDMCKAVDKHMRISGIRLLRKTGGKSGDFYADTH